MKIVFKAVVLGLVMVALSARSAEACHEGYEISRALFGLGALVVDTPLVIHNLAVDRSSRGYGIAEAVLTAPQIVLAATLISEGRKECEDAGGTLDAQSGGTGFSPVILGVSAALFVHAIYVIVTPRSSPAAPTQARSGPKVGFAPFLVTDRERVAGFTAGVTF